MATAAPNTAALRRLTQGDLDLVISAHERFVQGRPGGKRASLRCVDLSGLDLSNRDLSDADLSGSTFDNCQMVGIRLERANLFGCDLRRADLRGADFTGAVMRGVSLTGAMLQQIIGLDIKNENPLPGA